MENSKIEWTDHTFNPWIGCAKVSPGCAHCYAETLNNRMGWAEWGKGGKRKRTSPANWRKPHQWNASANGSRPRVFCASLADWLDEEVPDEWRDDLLNLIAETPNLDWLLLTKRIDRAVGMELPENVWLGTSSEDQARWDERIPVLMSIPATIHFVSAEPLIGPIHMGETRPEWLIVGGESGPKARPMEKDWVRHLHDQCDDRTAFFFKQWGGVRKKETGRELDGRIHDSLPLEPNPPSGCGSSRGS